MFNFFKKKKVNHLTVKCSTEGITINDKAISFPTDYNTLIDILGEPSRKIEKTNTYVLWDDYGVFYGSNNLNKVLSIKFFQNKKDTTEYNTKNQFKGSLFLDDEEITHNEFVKIPLGKMVIHRLGSESESRFGFSIGANLEYKQ